MFHVWVLELWDLGKISLKLIRFFDCESYDACQVEATFEDWAKEIDYMIVKQNAFRVEGSYAYVLMTKIMRVRTVVVKGTTYSIGCHGPPEADDVAYAFKKFCAWTTMSISLVNAEFPLWELSRAFAIFNIERLPPPEVREQHMMRLCRYFRINFDAFKRQYDTTLANATEQFKRTPNMSMAEIWDIVNPENGHEHISLS